MQSTTHSSAFVSNKFSRRYSVRALDRIVVRGDVEIENLESTIGDLEDKVAALELELSDLREDLDYNYVPFQDYDEKCGELQAALDDSSYWESMYGSATSLNEEKEEELEALREELESYRLIETQTGKTPDEIAEAFNNLASAAEMFKCPTCSGED